jgi:hypothetical protein
LNIEHLFADRFSKNDVIHIGQNDMQAGGEFGIEAA